MALVLNEEQRYLKETAREFFRTQMPVDVLRQLRAGKCPVGYRNEDWQQMNELGWAGIILPEEYGGLDFGYMGLGAILEEGGRTLAPSPLLSSVVMGATLILQAGSAQQREQLLPAIASGELTVAVALEEGHHHDPYPGNTTLVADGDGFILSGTKSFVADGFAADKLIVVARSAGSAGQAEGLSLVLVDGDQAGLTKQPRCFADSRAAASISFDDIRLPASALLGDLHGGTPPLELALDCARICLGAEMFGGALECFERTVDYLKEREQFGVKIGSFQALQHRASLMYIELQLTKSVVLDALSAIDEKRADLPQLASLAKARCNDVFELVTSEAVQMHGGIGVTDELDIGLFLKRSRMASQQLGSSGFHRDRYATLCGY